MEFGRRDRGLPMRTQRCTRYTKEDNVYNEDEFRGKRRELVLGMGRKSKIIDIVKGVLQKYWEYWSNSRIERYLRIRCSKYGL